MLSIARRQQIQKNTPKKKNQTNYKIYSERQIDAALRQEEQSSAHITNNTTIGPKLFFSTEEEIQ